MDDVMRRKKHTEHRERCSMPGSAPHVCNKSPVTGSHTNERESACGDDLCAVPVCVSAVHCAAVLFVGVALKLPRNERPL